jgi:hypothetical protein
LTDSGGSGSGADIKSARKVSSLRIQIRGRKEILEQVSKCGLIAKKDEKAHETRFGIKLSFWIRTDGVRVAGKATSALV